MAVVSKKESINSGTETETVTVRQIQLEIEAFGIFSFNKIDLISVVVFFDM